MKNPHLNLKGDLMKLTKKRAIELHRELWDWLYHHPSKIKEDWPRWEKNGGDIPYTKNDCFLCDYLNKVIRQSCFRYPCILDWGQQCCFDAGAYYTIWDASISPKTRKKYARMIRDLKERK